jgi:hypothetical protein
MGLKIAPLQLIEMGKQTLQLALEMTDLEAISEISFCISQICNTVNDNIRLYKRD